MGPCCASQRGVGPGMQPDGFEQEGDEPRMNDAEAAALLRGDEDGGSPGSNPRMSKRLSASYRERRHKEFLRKSLSRGNMDGDTDTSDRGGTSTPPQQTTPRSSMLRRASARQAPEDVAQIGRDIQANNADEADSTEKSDKEQKEDMTAPDDQTEELKKQEAEQAAVATKIQAIQRGNKVRAEQQQKKDELSKTNKAAEEAAIAKAHAEAADAQAAKEEADVRARAAEEAEHLATVEAQAQAEAKDLAQAQAKAETEALEQARAETHAQAEAKEQAEAQAKTEMDALQQARAEVDAHVKAEEKQAKAEEDKLEKSRSEPGKVCSCGSVYMDDATFCRQCGEKRPQAADAVEEAPDGDEESDYEF